MCGICGIFRIEQQPVTATTQQVVAAMSAAMARRGPDDEGFWADQHCAFGFRRLAILDLSPAGHQPMLSSDGRYVLVFNGELYNFQELRARLELQGVRFRSTGDTEVVLYALAAWGTAALKQFNGMFALALYDVVEHRLLLARDHAGIKPLYYLRTPQGIAFGSQFDQLLHHPWAERLGISPEALSLYLRFGYIPAPYALLARTHQLDAGSWLCMDATGKVEQGQFYAFPMFTHPTLRGEAAVAALDEALQRAVARHLISDVPLGVFLSGGIDSPLVAAEAKRLSGQPLQAFTIGVPGNRNDETADARCYAEELGLQHMLLPVDQHTALDMLDQVVEACSEPLADFSMFPTLLVSQLARRHVKVALSGDGGDELYWGYVSRFSSALEQASYFRLSRPARFGHIAVRRMFNVGKATREILWPSIGRLYQKKHTLMAEADLVAIFPALPSIPADLGLFDYQGTDPQETAQWLRWNEFRMHLARVLLKVDRASMFHSLEVRVPLLDRDVIDVAVQTDWASCLDLRARRGKIPLRRLLGKRVRYQTEAKKGFTVPMSDWLVGPLQPLVRDMLLSRPSLLGQELHRPALDRVFQQLLAGDQSKAWGLWQLLILVLWEERYLQRRPGLARSAG